MDKNKLFDEKKFFGALGMCAPWKKFGQKMKNFEIFFQIIDSYACLYMHDKFRQIRSKFGSVITRYSKMPHHGISIFANFYRLRVIFESGYMRLLLSFFLPYVHLRLTVLRRPNAFFGKRTYIFAPKSNKLSSETRSMASLVMSNNLLCTLDYLYSSTDI